MRYLVVPAIMVVIFFYLADQYFTHGAYYDALQAWVQSFF